MSAATKVLTRTNRFAAFALRRGCRDAALERIDIVLKPFLRIAASEDGLYPLREQQDLDLRACKSAAWKVFGRRVTGFTFISALSPVPRPAWMGDQGYRDLVVSALNDGLTDAIEESVWLGSRLETAKRQYPEVGDELMELLSSTDFCHRALKSHFDPKWWNGGLDQRFGDELWLSLADAVALYILAEIRDDRDEAGEYAALLKVMRQTMLIGFLAADSTNLICVTR